MPVKFAETVRRCMGWCPKKEVVYFGGARPATDRQIHAPLNGNSHVVEDVIVDFQSRGLPIPAFICLVVALSVAAQYLFATYRAVFSVLAVSSLLAFIAVEVYAKRKKSRVAISRSSIVLFRPLLKPAVIPRESVLKTEVKDNTVPLSPKVIGVFVVIVLALCIEPVYNALYGGLMQADPTRIVYGMAVPLVLVVLFYRAYSRALYKKTVVITSTVEKVVAIFTDDPGKITALLEGP